MTNFSAHGNRNSPKMPAASSKPTSQNLDSEAQDPVKLLIGALEKKARNLEKRKTKLETYKEMVNNGKSLNKDQEEAVSHYQEVQGNLNFAREFLGTIQTLITETSKAKKKHEKRESQQRQELEMQRIQDILLLQNVLNQMGQDHIRNDFLAGTNGAEAEDNYSYLKLFSPDGTGSHEFYTIVNPSRESEEGEETEKTEKKSFDEKMAEAAVHLDKFLKLDESEVCGTTYKYLKLLVQRIHKCGYLDKVPEPPAEEPEPPAPAPPTAAVVPEDVQDEPEDTENTEVEEDYSPSVLPTSHTVVSNEVSGFSQSSQQQEVLTQPPVADIPNPPEPIEMPPPKSSYTHDVNDVLAPVQGGVTFLQESVVDVDSPHLDPAVVAVSLMPSQSYMSAAFQSTADSSSMDHQVTPSSQMDQPGDSLRQSSQTDNVYASQPDQVYSQNIYDSQQTLIGNTQQSMPSGQHEYTSQQNLPASSQHDFTSQQSMPANQHDYTSQQNLPAAQHDYTSQQNLQSSQQSIGQQGLVSQQQSMGQPGLVSQQGYIDQANFGSQAGMNTGPVGLGGSQPSLSSGPSQTDYSGSHQPLSGNTSQMDQSQSVGYNATGTQNMSDLRDFRNSPIDPQLTKPESSTSANSYQPGSLQTASSQYTSSDLPSTDGFGQTLQGTSQLSTDVSSMGTSGGNVTPPQSIPFPNEQSAATTQGLNKDSLEETSSSSSSSLPKSTMNAAAPPFQSSARTSPHMQTIQGTTPEVSGLTIVV
ncbi:Caprin-1 [Holothuria leucospilota]|uniref:Caprin-1 n=1 Tax=Holothuria leucospilota TaxID=206669 RepID=A0A9Q1BFH6_HOLLE|nr:Caprin-1 [Holothuria leucospilota]